MGKYLISFPARALVATGAELEAISVESRAMVAEAKAAGVWVFGGGLNASVTPVTVEGDGSTTGAPYPEFALLDGGFTVLEVPTRAEAELWAARFATACHAPQELREFHYDPES